MLPFCIAAGLGAVLRYLADLYLPRYGILLVNILGSFIAGATLGLASAYSFPTAFTQLILGSFAGSLTTYATVAVTTAQQRSQGTGGATKTWTVQVGLSIAACLIGLLSAIALTSGVTTT